MNWAELAEVVVAALVTGVGAVVLFALGVRGWSDHADTRSVVGLGTAVVSFALCAALVGVGIWVIVSK
ncbi:hypothetical protein [Actinokineospora bangkokensis]|uniref:Uncharacterized protein n=1 Tax=Actinokineospora bangkokensis TaxID=1193682 RepID=A0A1Q9LBU7_9PSEU|nr:hypothetical protein [Actinokineospora bangkokensis]OLR89498.1 hypothetical protein BJP25_05285 [Actinokineospora bangkokensis]